MADESPTRTTPSADAPTRVHYVQGTHWDREWYHSFQGFRARLVRAMDRLMDILVHRDDFERFFADGQTSLIDDYLAIRPERRDELMAHVRSGRILVGPWLTMPDEFLPSGEALVRNLLAGCRAARRWGAEPMRSGYVCDIFGHISQLPQLLRGFGIDHAVFFRGTNDVTDPPRFRWHAPDGSAVLGFKLPDREAYGMCNPCVRDAYQGRPIDVAQAAQTLVDLVVEERERTGLADVLMLDAHDHSPPEEVMADILAEAARKMPDWDIRWSTMADYAAAVRDASADWPAIEGELRHPAAEPGPWLLGGVFSSRVHLKQANVRCLTLLEAWAEPLAVLTRAAGYDGGRSYVDLAWNYLLMNHAHDSICGCSRDQVHRDMMYRFDQSRMLAEIVRAEAAEVVARAVAVERRDGDQVFQVWNPLPVARDEVVDLHLLLHDDGEPALGAHGAVSFQTFDLLDATGRPVPYQLVSTEPRGHVHVPTPAGYTSGEAVRPANIAAKLRLPACGYTTLTVRPLERRRLTSGSLCPAPAAMENDHLRVDVRADGTWDLADKRCGAVYRGLGLLEDSGDVGDGWNHFPPPADEVHSSLGAPTRIARIADGREKTTLRITQTLRLPAFYDTDRLRRSTRTVDLDVTTELTLRRDAAAIECETRVENTACDHALHLLLPTDLAVDEVLAETPFDVVRRPVKLADPSASAERDLELKPVTSFVGGHDGTRGLFVTTEGLHAAGLRDDPRRTLVVALFRAFPRNFENKPLHDRGGEVLRSLCLRWQVVPVAGAFDAAAMAMHARRLTTGLYVHKSRWPRDDASLPPEQGLAELGDGRLTLSALKANQAGDGAIVRVVNFAEQPATDRVRFARPVARWRSVTLEELPAGEWRTCKDGWIPLAAEPKQLVTVEVEWRE